MERTIHMFRKLDDCEIELNSLRRENANLKKRLNTMQETIKRYQLEKKELLSKLGINNTGAREDGFGDV